VAELPHHHGASVPITSLSITSNSTGDVISLGSVAIAAGTTYTFDLRYGYKTVKTDAGVNKIADVTAASTLRPSLSSMRQR
jgi:hypothetical protein